MRTEVFDNMICGGAFPAELCCDETGAREFCMVQQVRGMLFSLLLAGSVTEGEDDADASFIPIWYLCSFWSTKLV